MDTRPTPKTDPDQLATLTAWIDGRLGDAGIRRRGAVELLRAWARATLVTFETDRGRMWAKAVPEAFAHEVAVTLLLADIDPGVVPPVVAADAALGRIITEHVDGPALAALTGQPEAWAASLSRLAELQRVLAFERSALVIAGVAAAPLDLLADAIPRLLADDSLLQVGRPGGLRAVEVAALRDRIPALVDACHALEAIGIPDSLDHGDLTPDEVIVGGMGPVFLDWSDSSIAHPFMCAAALLAGGAAVEGPAEDRVGAYLGPWLSAGIGLSVASGREALSLAGLVLPFHRAAVHATRVLPGLGDGGDVGRFVPETLRAILPG